MNKISKLIISVCFVFVASYNYSFAQEKDSIPTKDSLAAQDTLSEEEIKRRNDRRLAHFDRLFIEGNLLKNKGEYTSALNKYLDCLLYEDSSIAVYYEIGYIYIQRENYSDAEEYVQKAITINPDEPRLYDLLTTIYSKTGNTKKHIETLQQLLKKHPRNLSLYIALADIYKLNNTIQKSIQLMNHAESKFPHNERLINKKTEYYTTAKQYTQAIAETEKLIRLNPHNQKYKLRKATLLYKSQSYDKALEISSDITNQSFYKDSALILETKIYAQQDKVAEITSSLRSLASLYTSNNEILKSLIESYIISAPKTSTIYAQKTNILHELHKTFPDNPAIIKHYADILYAEDSTNQNIKELYYAYIQNNKSERLLYSRIIQLEQRVYNWDSVIYVAEEATKAFPLYASFPLAVAESYYYLHSYREALSYLKNLDTFLYNAEEKAAHKSWIGFIYFKLRNKKNTNTENYFQEARDHSTHDYFYQQLYTYYMVATSQETDSTQSYITQCTKHKPYDLKNTYITALIAFNTNSIEKSKTIISQLLEEYTHADFIELYGDILYTEDEEKKAKKQWEKAEELGNNINFKEKTVVLQKNNK
ncbi:MAG: tetratricopeptide repeat protein [Bacteroidales bacterium]